MPFADHIYASPLRYPGGKAPIANFIKLVLCQNNLLDRHYIEVYAGGASIAWSLLFEEYVQRVTINDISKPLHAFWHSVLYDTEQLCKLINDTPVTIQEWHYQKSLQSKPDCSSLLELGFSTFFLNRTNRSGILQAGVIGGKTQKGKWKVDARFNKKNLVSRIQRIARYSSRISLYNLDAAFFIKTILPDVSTKSLVYLDPPYYAKGQGLYENHYLHDDHINLASLISKQIKQSWIVSYDAAPEIIEPYSQHRNIQYSLNYSAQKRYAGSEIMFFSNDLIIPEVKNRSEDHLQESTAASIHPARVKQSDLLLSLQSA